MSNYLGIDIGSTSSSVVLIDEQAKVLFSSYRFHAGQIIPTLNEQLSGIDLRGVTGFAFTSSCPDIFKSGLKTDSRVSYITTAKHFHPGLEGLLIIGGEKFGLVSFGRDGEYLNYRSNTSCASGTGSFLDQQLSRLNLKDISEFGQLSASSNGKYPKIASRCSVFAKTDLIHAQQEGYTLAEISDGLCYGLAKNVIDTVFDESTSGRIVVAGGVSLNTGVTRHIQEITGAELIIDEYSNLYGAIGAALQVREEPGLAEASYNTAEDLISTAVKQKNYYNEPLKLKLSSYPDFSALEEFRYPSKRFPDMSKVEVSIYEMMPVGGTTEIYLGIDIGSTSTKAVLLDQEKRVLAGFYTRTSGQPVAAVQTVFEAIEHLAEMHGHKLVVRGAGTTGSGRKLIGKIINADTVPDEISAHARAACELDPEVDTIIEIGGQDSKFTMIKDGIVTLSIMNNVCAAGTGSFIEEQAHKLGCPLSEYAERAERSSSPMTSDRCTVFMERDLNHYLNEGYEKDELLASVLHSIRDNYLTKVTGKATIGNKIFFQGATAKNRALVAAFEQKLQKPIMVSKFCHLTGALGVALELHDSKLADTAFRGIGIWKDEIAVRSEVCELCTNSCKLKIAEIGGETLAYGFLCGRDYETERFVKNEGDSFDLMRKYRQVFAYTPETRKPKITVGIPYTLHLAEEMVLWRKFFDLMGVGTITSEKYTQAVREGKKLADAEFCAPVSAAYGHVAFLRDKAPFIFLPMYLETGENTRTSKWYCFYTQHINPVIASTKDFRDGGQLLMPLVKSLRPASHAIKELLAMFKKMGLEGVSSEQVRTAYTKAKAYYAERLKEWQQVYLEEKVDGKPNVVLLGRPYTVLSSSMNSNIPEIISKNGYQAFYQNMIPDEKGVANRKLEKNIYWKYATTILHKTEEIARSKDLYPILVTSFKCTPDSFVIEYFREIMDAHHKPYLILQLDEHDSAVGYETRIEAAIRSFNNHYNKQVLSEEDILLAEDTGKSGLSRVAGEMMDDLKDILKEHNIEPGFLRKYEVETDDSFALSSAKYCDSSEIEGKTILLPAWDLYIARLLAAVIEAEGWKVIVIKDSPDSIQRSLNHNTGQCLPLNVVAQNAIEYIRDHDLDPSTIAIWVPHAFYACNLSMFPHYIRKVLGKYDERMAEVTVYQGNPGFYDFSIKMGVNAYLSYMFSGSLRKIACMLRPYEKVKGQTDQVMEESLTMLEDAFRFKKSKEAVLKKISALIDSIEITPGSRPKVAIFGDIYARDNDIFNQDLVKVIEDNGGEALPTSYTEYIKIVLKQTEMRMFLEGRYKDHYNLRFLKYLIPPLENKYNKYFEKYIKNIEPLNSEMFKILEKHNMHVLHRGETVDNILKIENLVRNYDDITLFVQTNPAYCCPSLVTEAMSANIEKVTGIPVISIEYDGTRASKNDVVIPYLKLRRLPVAEMVAGKTEV